MREKGRREPESTCESLKQEKRSRYSGYEKMCETSPEGGFLNSAAKKALTRAIEPTATAAGYLSINNAR